MKRRKLPIGIQSFEDIRKKGFVYVDKTQFVWDIAQFGKPYFLSRPRRFGKSLFLSTLEAYFLGKRDLFDGLAIQKLEDEEPEPWQEYPVFYFDFSPEKYEKREDLEELLDRHLTRLEKQLNVPVQTERSSATRLSVLIEVAYQKTGKQVVVLVDFPLFEWNEDENKWDPAHHMFSMPQEKYLPTLEQDPGSVKGDLYDLVLNGYEVASGSIRIHEPELQKRIFNIVGFAEEEAERKFGFLLEAFRYGPPPHGGIAPGLDRILMIMAGETSIKEVIAFPKNTFAVSPMDDCPSYVDEKQLKELSLSIIKNK